MALSPRHRYLIGFNATGNLGPFVIFTSRTKGTVWYVKPHEAKFFCWRKTHYNNRFRTAAWAWRSLTQGKRDDWNTAARRARLYLHGYALWVWWQIRRDLPALKTIERQSRVTLLDP